MITGNMKAIISQLNNSCRASLEGAAGVCVSRTHYAITVEHFFGKLIENPFSDLSLILRHFEKDTARLTKLLAQDLEEMRTGNPGSPTFAEQLLDLFENAWLFSSLELEEGAVRSGACVLAFLKKPHLYASGKALDFLKQGINAETLKAQFFDIVKGSDEKETAPKGGGAGVAGGETGAAGAAPSGDSALAKYCTDFTGQAKAGKIDAVFGRDEEIRQMFDIFARRRKNNPICVGEPGVGKTAVVEGLALRISQNDVPDFLKNTRLLGLDMGLLQAGAGMKGEFENRLNQVINEVKGSAQPIILFIDEAHTLIGAGGAQGGGDAANLLKPALARGELRTVAATTWTEYKKYFEKDPALARRFQLVKLDEPSVKTSILILRGLKDNYEKSHNVVVRDDAIIAAAEMSARYITGRYLPDKAVDLLDTAAARVKVLLSAKPAPVDDLERRIMALERAQAAIERDKRNGQPYDVEELENTIADLEKSKTDFASLSEVWKQQQQAAYKVIDARKMLDTFAAPPMVETPEPPEPTDKPAHEAEAPAEAKAPEAVADAPAEGEAPAEATASDAPEAAADAPKSREEAKAKLDEAMKAFEALTTEDAMVKVECDPDVVAKVVADWTGVPVGKVVQDEAAAVLGLADTMKSRIKGQDHAIEAMCEVIKAAKSGLKDPTQPMGVFFLAGPSGVGKTETALTVAEQLFGSEKNVITINMSEFQEKHTLSRLIGSPPGYVGYGEGGVLTEGVRQTPYTVVLLDETEKAHPDILNLFYQVFDKGVCNDGEGREINFQNTIIFLTSNLGTDTITKMTSEGQSPMMEAVLEATKPEFLEFFKPALLARMTLLPYYALDPEALRMIVDLKLNKLAKRMKENQKIRLEVAAEVKDQIGARCREVDTGARNIDHILNGSVLPLMSNKLLARMGEGEKPEQVKLTLDEAGDIDVIVE